MSIQELIDNNSCILADNQNEYMCILNSSELERFTEQWRYNRNLNSEKINQIMETVSNKLVLDTTLHFYYDFTDINGEITNERLICFDGNHRREALILLYNLKQKNIKVCCYIYKSNNKENIDYQITRQFKIINQMTPIPDIYNEILNTHSTTITTTITQNINQKEQLEILINKKDIIEEILKEYKQKYKRFYSTNSKCNRPNFNDTKFMDLCNDFKFSTKIELVSLLDKLNKNKSQTKNKSITQNILNKCKTENFYLFL
jgi:uncharacterized protein YfcZ (UPF0381/DUF406 family)